MFKTLTAPFRRMRTRWRRFRDAWRLLQTTPHRLAELSAEMAEHRRETRIMYTALARRRSDDLANPPIIPGEPGTNVLPHSIACRSDSFLQPWFSYWTGRFRVQMRRHRKLWEFVFIVQALWERGALKPGSRGLGFGVGTEPMAALFASEGCAVVGTDMAPDGASALGWIETQQHALGKEALRKPELCPDDVFEKNVSFRVVDMNHVPDDLTGYLPEGPQVTWLPDPGDVKRLDDGAVLSLAGVDLTVRHAPGHTQGSVMFSLDLGEAPGLLAGDVLFAGSVGRVDLPGGSWDAMLSSLRDVVLPLDDETVVLPGHGPATTIGRERATNPYLAEAAAEPKGRGL